MSVPDQKTCLNCKSELLPNEHFCSNCGQKATDGDLRLRTILREFAGVVFNLDSRFFKTVRNIWRPHFLTKEYISGRRKSYLLPGQIFFFTMFLHFTVILISIPSLNKLNQISSSSKFEKKKLSERYDTLSALYIQDTVQIKLLKDTLFEKLDEDDFIVMSIIKGISRMDKYNLKVEEIYSKTEEEIIKDHNIDNFIDRMILSQFIKIEFNPIGSIKFLIGNFAWAIVILVLFLGLISKLLYIRHKYLYAEHLTLWLHLHTTLFLVIILALLLGHVVGEDSGFLNAINWIVGILFVVIPYLTFKKFYKQGFFKTAVKLFMIFMIYTFALSMIGLFVSMINFVFI